MARCRALCSGRRSRVPAALGWAVCLAVSARLWCATADLMPATPAPESGDAIYTTALVPPSPATDAPGVQRAFHLAPFLPTPYRNSSSVLTYFNAITEDCGTVLFAAPSKLKKIINDKKKPTSPRRRPKDEPFNATIAWYKIHPTCAIPISVMEFSGCRRGQPLDACALQSLPRWLGYDNFSAPTDDLLGLAMHAPPEGIDGLYARLVQARNWTEVTHFVLSQKDYPPCRFSHPVYIHASACATPEQFASGISMDRIGMSVRYIPENQRRIVSYLLRLAGWPGAVAPSRSVFVPERVAETRTLPPPKLELVTEPSALDPHVDDDVPNGVGPTRIPERIGPEASPDEDLADAGEPGVVPAPPSRGLPWPIIGGVVAGAAAAASAAALGVYLYRRRGSKFRHTPLPLLRP
ncbi:envelope glycoprotein D [Saimiriine alphaherpesvirus 1]|uniref:Envelope glycoprotein D n=1 Tax=Saimiriine herpesvirus 1 (strain MV-5-4-PSL) TaxID=10353 RepID=E2IUH8_SHV1|nr:envelope glycoprotein D [Saimiriine alphaherpesvirus 1]ADO13836.1 envelope glycoprotein D [Saimiriine alphaherpesvirus 1]